MLSANFLLLQELANVPIAKSATGLSKKLLGSNTHADVAQGAFSVRLLSVSMAVIYVTAANTQRQEIGRNASSAPSAVTLLGTELQELTTPLVLYAEVSTSSRILMAKTFVLNVHWASTLMQEKFAPGVAKGGTWYSPILTAVISHRCVMLFGRAHTVQ